MAQWLACLSRNWLLNVWPEFEPESGQKGLLPKRSGQERPGPKRPTYFSNILFLLLFYYFVMNFVNFQTALHIELLISVCP